ncbi:MAG TPA: acyltransferase [Pirellulales bacterium]|nr:acyltransferase [Pirellulales bacterium]
MTANNRRILELDALRGFAALAVVLFHFTTRYDQVFGHIATLPASCPWGSYGVDLFLMLSGFVILRSLDRTQHAGDFIVGRFARLYPAYWVAGAITFGVVTLFGLSGQEVSLREAALNSTMLQRLLGARHIDGAYWSLEVELFFYAFAFALHRAGAFRTPRRQHIALALWLFAEAVSMWIMSHGESEAGHSLALRLTSKLQVLLSLRYAHLFTIGILLYRGFCNRNYPPIAWLLLAACWTLQGMADSWAAALGIAMLTAVLYGAVEGRLGWLAARPLAFLGAISYPLYLIHQNVGYVLIRELESLTASPVAAIALAMTFSLAAATGLSLAIERPVQKWIVNRWKNAPLARISRLQPASPGRSESLISAELR